MPKKKQIRGKDLVPEIIKEKEERIKRSFKEDIKHATREVSSCAQGVEVYKKKLEGAEERVQKLLNTTLEEYAKDYKYKF